MIAFVGRYAHIDGRNMPLSDLRLLAEQTAEILKEEREKNHIED